MTTTSEFQIQPDYYASWEKCQESLRNRIQTNTRYRNFTQTHLTAGDESQFEEYRDATNNQVCIQKIDLRDNLFVDNPFSVWNGYKDLQATAVMNTFRYIFYKFKKGIFVKIVNNQLRVFLPFSNANFINEWGDRMKVDNAKYGSVNNFLQHISKMEGRDFNPSRVNNFTSGWYANGCLVRYEWPLSEGDTNVSNVKNMLEELCEKRQLPDMEFFINRRDFPILTKDGTEPYNNIWDSEAQPLVSHKYSQYLHIFSMSTSNRYADITIPTHEDWARVQSKEGKWFPKSCREYKDDFVAWKEKTIETAVFRGGSTGCGVTVNSNPRLHLSYISSKAENIPYLDAGITNWNLRPRKLQGDKYLRTIEIEKLPFKLVGRLSPEEQARYKYIVNVDGHVTAFRLSLELSTGSVILLVKSPWKIWYSDILKPYEHYVPVNEDLSNVIEQIKWCKEHDDDCRKIAQNARNFYDTYLQKDGVLDYLQKVLVDTKKEIGVYLYNYTSPLDLQIQEEYENLEGNVYPDTKKSVVDITTIPSMGRSYGLLQGVQWIVNMINTTDSFENIARENKLIFKNKLGDIREFLVANFYLAVKTTRNTLKRKEHIHETFVGTKCLNNLSKYVPNFVYIFGAYEKDDSFNVITEKIHGQSFTDWIKSKEFTMIDYLFILIQISLAIQVAQNNCGFVHYDLTPWNIVIQKLDTPVSFDYILGYNQVIRVKTTLIPVIIDYGKSHVIHNGIHHGFINMYKVSTIQDILTLLVTSVLQVLQDQRLSKQDFSDLITTANFLTKTGYRQQSFQSANDMKTFLKSAGKYSVLISSNKHELEQKTPMDFVRYIQSNTKTRLPFGVVPEYKSTMNKGNGRQVFDYILCHTVKEKADTYLEVFSRLKHCTLPQPKNLFFVYYAVQSLEENLLSVRSNMMYFLQSNNIDSEYHDSVFRNTMRFLLKFYKAKIQNIDEEDVEYDIEEDFNSLKIAEYTESTFLLPEIVYGLVENIHTVDQSLNDIDLSDYKEIIEHILLNKGKYELSEKDRVYYIRNFAKLLNTNQLNMKNNTANIKTLRNTALNMYTKDKTQLSTVLQSETGDCSYATRYMEMYQEIIDKLV